MIKMYINDEEIVCKDEISIEEEALVTSSTTLANVYPKSWEDTRDYTSKFYYPPDYSKFRIINDDELIFSGVVKNTGNISLNPRCPHYASVQILDYKTLLSEGETLDFVISEKTIREAIEQVISAVADYGFVVGNIEIFGADDIIGAYSTKNKTAYEVFEYICGITQSKWFTRRVSEDVTAIDFYDPTLMPSGLTIDYTTEFFDENSIDDISFNYGTYDYRNKQIIQSSEVYASIDYNEQIIADGLNNIFNISTKIGIINKITVNGTEASFATKNEKDAGVVADFYYTPSNTSLESDTTYSQGTVIIINYTPLVEGRQIVYNTDEINRVTNQLNRKGVIARYEDRNDVTSSAELSKIGSAYIRYKGIPEITLTVKTTNKDLYQIGQIMYFNAPLDELKQQYMLKKKTTDIKFITDNYCQTTYTYELTSSFNSENAINYFDNQRSKATGNISEGEYISRNIDIENSMAIIFDNLEITQAEEVPTLLDALIEVKL